MKFIEYLNKKYRSSTARVYLFEIEKYLEYSGRKAKSASYVHITNYIEYLRTIHKNPRTINRILSSLKAYYFYLIDTHQREDHPCRYIKLRDAKNKPIQLQDLLTSKEIKQLLNRKERYSHLAASHKVTISLLVYQALTANEITRLTVKDLNLKQANIRVKATSKLHARILPLEASQVMLMHRYLEKDREKLKKNDTSALLLNKSGNPIDTDTIRYLVSTFQPMFSDKKVSPRIIRQSVIANLLKPVHLGGEGKGLRKVQVFAGHKMISSTEKYKPSISDTLLAELEKYHPLN